MEILVQPAELNFVFIPETILSSSVQLINNSGRHIAFKFKTTKVKKYAVNPPTGIIKPHSKHVVRVLRRPEPIIPPPDVIAKEKFLVQSIFVPEGSEFSSIASTFSSKDDRFRINEVLIRVDVVGMPKMVEELKPKLEGIDLRPWKAEETVLLLKEGKSSNRRFKGKMKSLFRRLRLLM